MYFLDTPSTCVESDSDEPQTPQSSASRITESELSSIPTRIQKHAVNDINDLTPIFTLCTVNKDDIEHISTKGQDDTYLKKDFKIEHLHDSET